MYECQINYKIIFVCVILFRRITCLYENNTNIVHLTPNNFDDKVTKSSFTWLVQFFSSSCPYCEDFAPKFEQAAKVLKDTVKVGVIDSDEDKSLLRRFHVKAVPSVKIYRPNSPQPEDYSGPRTPEDIVKKVSTHFKKSVKRKLRERSKLFVSHSAETDYED